MKSKDLILDFFLGKETQEEKVKKKKADVNKDSNQVAIFSHSYKQLLFLSSLQANEREN